MISEGDTFFIRTLLLVAYTHSAPVFTSNITSTNCERRASRSSSTRIALNLESGKVRVYTAIPSFCVFNVQSFCPYPPSQQQARAISIMLRIKNRLTIVQTNGSLPSQHLQRRFFQHPPASQDPYP